MKQVFQFSYYFSHTLEGLEFACSTNGFLLFLEGMPNSPQPWHIGQAKPVLVKKDEVSN